MKTSFRTGVLVFTASFVLAGVLYVFLNRPNPVVVQRQTESEVSKSARIVTNDAKLRSQLINASDFEQSVILQRLWDSYKPSLDATNADAVTSVVKSIIPSIDTSVTHVPERENLDAVIEDFLQANALRRPSIWYEKLGKQGFTIDERHRSAILQEGYSGIPSNNDPVACSSYMAQIASDFLGQTPVKRYDTKHIKAVVYNVSSINSPSRLAYAISFLHGVTEIQTAKMRPRHSLDDIIKAQGEATICELLMFAKPMGSPVHTMRPVVLYLYFDSISHNWVMSMLFEFPPASGEQYVLYLYI